jgi:hypothetical protein
MTFGQVFYRLPERQPLNLFDELDDVAALAAAETLVELVARMHVKRRSPLFVKGAASLETLRTGFAERNVFTHNPDNIHLLLQPSDEIVHGAVYS